jgi:hypothetical protein
MDLPGEGDMNRQNAPTDYLWSQAYADLGLIDAAAPPAQDAFITMKQIKSCIHMMRIIDFSTRCATRCTCNGNGFTALFLAMSGNQTREAVSPFRCLGWSKNTG